MERWQQYLLYMARSLAISCPSSFFQRADNLSPYIDSTLRLPYIPLFCFHRYQSFVSFFFTPSNLRFISYFAVSLYFTTISFSSNYLYRNVWRWEQPRRFFLFCNILQSKGYHVRFLGGKYDVLDEIQWMRESSANDGKELVAVMQYESPIRQQPSVAPGFRCTNDAVAHELGLQRTRQSCWHGWWLVLMPWRMVVWKTLGRFCFGIEWLL